MLDAGADPADPAAAEAAARALRPADLDRADLRGPPADAAASAVAAIPGGARGPAGFQRGFGRAARRGAGRARHRHGRVSRRAGETVRHRQPRGARPAPLARNCWRRGVDADLATVTAEVRARDAADAARAAAPMKPAADATLLDTTELDADQAFAAALALLAVTDTNGRNG